MLIINLLFIAAPKRGMENTKERSVPASAALSCGLLPRVQVILLPNMYSTSMQRNPHANILNRRIPKPSYRHAAPAGLVAPIIFCGLFV